MQGTACLPVFSLPHSPLQVVIVDGPREELHRSRTRALHRGAAPLRQLAELLGQQAIRCTAGVDQRLTL